MNTHTPEPEPRRVIPQAGEPWSRAAERFVFEGIVTTPDYTAELLPRHAHGGDIIVDRPDGTRAVIEVRSIDDDYGPVPFFDLKRGLKTQRRLQDKVGADLIIVVGLAIKKPAGVVTAIGALGGERFEWRARLAEQAYLAESPNHTKIARPIWISEMDPVDDLLPGVSF